MEYLEKLKLITYNLNRCERVRRYNSKDENEVETLANAYIDIEESINILLPLLSNFYAEDISIEKIDDLVLDIGEELRHILYHIYDTKTYHYLRQDVE